ncbi:MAG: hypothetical protein L6R30_20625 [Thermoanaerobaculia bacterium]|nr:hypothetical protein [Thermoanaerobaculia bacterium]
MERATLETFVVTVGDDALPRLSEVAKSLSEKGLEVEDVGLQTGVISGRAPRSLMAALLDVDGVEAVEISRRVSL